MITFCFSASWAMAAPTELPVPPQKNFTPSFRIRFWALRVATSGLSSESMGTTSTFLPSRPPLSLMTLAAYTTPSR